MKVKIYEDKFNRMVCITFYEEGLNGEISVVKPVNFILEKVKEGEYGDIKPTIAITKIISYEFLKDLRKELDNLGIKTEEESVVKGRYEATIKHLEDLRGLLKLSKTEKEKTS